MEFVHTRGQLHLMHNGNHHLQSKNESQRKYSVLDAQCQHRKMTSQNKAEAVDRGLLRGFIIIVDWKTTITFLFGDNIQTVIKTIYNSQVVKSLWENEKKFEQV